MKCLVTGGSGFIGKAIVSRLLKENHEIIITGCKSENSPPTGVKLLQVHFDGIAWDELQNIDVVIHQAADNDTMGTDLKEMLKANCSAPIKLFERCYEGGCRKFVYASSTATYGNAPAPYIADVTPIAPLNPYAISKANFDVMAKDFWKKYPCDMVGLKYCNVYGPGEDHKGRRASMILQLAKQMMYGKNPKIFEFGEQKRDWIYVDDVVDANLAAMKFNGYGLFLCGSGTATTYNELIRLLNMYLYTNLQTEYIKNKYEGQFQNHTECDMTKTKELLGFVPKTSITDGIRQYIKYLMWGDL